MSGRTLRTLRGSAIRRHDPVGKRMGDQVYVHRAYAGLLGIGDDELERLGELCPFPFRCLVIDSKACTIRLDEAPDFDTAREPRVGRTFAVRADGSTRAGRSGFVWHHRQLWVLDDYQGFDVEAAWAWSARWLAVLREPASGSPRVWREQLLEHELPLA